MTLAGRVLSTGALVIVSAVLALQYGGAPRVVGVGPSARIESPATGFKLRQGRTVPVTVRVQDGAYPLRGWKLQLVDAHGAATELASGATAVTGRAVATLRAGDLTPGETYGLVVDAEDTVGNSATEQLSILVPDPQYGLIPLDAGSMLGRAYSGFTMDGSGKLVAMDGIDVREVLLVDATKANVTTLHLPLKDSEGLRLSKDGRRLLFSGDFDQGTYAIGIVALDTRAVTRGPHTPLPFFSVDAEGRRVAFQAQIPENPGDTTAGTFQDFLYDDTTKEVRQLTADPEAINFGAACPAVLGSTPMLSADGSTVAIATMATLGIVPTDPTVGCHIFAYEVPTGSLRHVLALPGEVNFDLPVVSDDGRWLSFVATRLVPPGIVRDFATLLDLTTGALDGSVGGISGFTTFDAAISGDASAIVVSTEADLDPRVGNADHNLELFVYDRDTGGFTQVTETLDGIGRHPGGCESYRPQVSTSAHIIAFSFGLFSTGGCQIDGPQHNESDGFVLGRVRAVRKRLGNHAPELAVVGDLRVTAGEAITVQFSATDADGDPIAFFAQVPGTLDVPPGGDFTDHHDGTATLRWVTKPEHVGLYDVRVGGFDEGGGEAVEDFTIAVCSRLVNDGALAGVLAALFESEPPPSCRGADINHDGRITAADMVMAVANPPDH